MPGTLRVAHVSPLTPVRMLGHINQVALMMASAAAVVIPSRREGFSQVFNEAILCNCRVLAMDVPVANEVLPKALIVQVDDALALREKLPG